MTEAEIVKMKNEAIATLKKQQDNDETEGAHIRADDVLRQLLIKLGFDDVVKEYDKVHKWFA